MWILMDADTDTDNKNSPKFSTCSIFSDTDVLILIRRLGIAAVTSISN